MFLTLGMFAVFSRSSTKSAPAVQTEWRWTWFQTVTPASLKTLFPQSSTFDYCTEGRGVCEGKTVFTKITLPRVKQDRNCNVEHQS